MYRFLYGKVKPTLCEEMPFLKLMRLIENSLKSLTAAGLFFKEIDEGFKYPEPARPKYSEDEKFLVKEFIKSYTKEENSDDVFEKAENVEKKF